VLVIGSLAGAEILGQNRHMRLDLQLSAAFE
jgi:hypothetical protein